jgi:tetratricopeptide (TPR) repeat protein
MEDKHYVIMESLRLVERREAEQAFNMLDSALAQATEENHVAWIKILCRHGAAVAQIAGDRRREIRYTEKALPYAKDYSFAIYNFAQLLLRDGQTGLAKQYATQAYELSTRGETIADRDLAAALLKQWPEIVENR